MNIKSKIVFAGILAVILVTVVLDFVGPITPRHRGQETTPGYVPIAGQRLKPSDTAALLSRRIDVRQTRGVNSPPVITGREFATR